MRFVRMAVITGLLAMLVLARPQIAHAQVSQCTGNKTVQVAPYSCRATKVIDHVTFDMTLHVDAAGRAEIELIMAPVQPVDVPVAVRSHTGVNGDPSQLVAAVIPAGSQTVKIVMPRVECGQLDIKAVETRPGAVKGRIAGPYVIWGESCAPVEVTTTSAPPTTGRAPTSRPPEATIIASTPTSGVSLPVTGATVPWSWAVITLSVAVLLILAARLPHMDT
jgi:hypothetical protein